MKRLLRAAATLLAAALPGSLLAGGLPATAHADDDARQGKLLMVLDSSGSMREPDGSGGTKIAAAKRALNTVVDKIPAEAQIGLRVYGASVFSKQDKGACTDSQLVVPIGKADKPALKRAIAGYQPYGETPIAYSLQQAAKDLGTNGRRTIVLVSDGEETCTPDPCEVAKQIAGIDLKIDVIGLRVDRKARDQLQCVADEGGGTYYDAENADDLVAGLQRTSLRAFRPFTIQGDPVTGALQPTADAPELQPGQYTDELGGYDEDTRTKYYRIPYRAGETVHIAVTGRPSLGKVDRDAFELKLLTPDGEECAHTQDALNDLGAQNRVLNASLYYAPGKPECDGQRELILKASRGLEGRRFAPKEGALPVELVVIQEPKLRAGQSLPEPARDGDVAQKPVPQGKTSGEVSGGASFNDAPTVAAGTWTDTLQTGEMLYYRTRVDWGQQLAVTFRMLPDSQVQHLLGYNGPPLSLYAYAPDRAPIGMSGTSAEIRKLLRPAETTTLHQTLPQVRYRNRERGAHEGPIAPVSLGGYYYYAIQLGTWGKQAQVPVQISVQLDGQQAGKPAYAPAEARATDNDGDGNSSNAKQSDDQQASQPTDPTPSGAEKPLAARIVPVALVAGSGVLVLAGVILAVILLRRE